MHFMKSDISFITNDLFHLILGDERKKGWMKWGEENPVLYPVTETFPCQNPNIETFAL